MKMLRLTAFWLAVVMVCTAMPVSATAADVLPRNTACTVHTTHTHGQSAKDCSGLAPYQGADGNFWAVVTDNEDHTAVWRCFRSDIDGVLAETLQRMLQRETGFVFYVAVKKSEYNPDTHALRKAMSARLISNALAEQVGTIEGGDFLDAHIQHYDENDLDTRWLNVEAYDDEAGAYAFYEVHCNFRYCDTLQQIQIFRQGAQRWNQLFVTENPAIAAETDKDRRQYLIVKTIYNFLAENTVYNTEAYDASLSGGKTDWYAHTAYAAFFGAGGQEATDLAGTGYDWSVQQKNSLTELCTTGQGKAVCEGYAAVFYYLCRLNGIACNTVIGNKTILNPYTGQPDNDLHAWNCVYLNDGSGSGYQWYQVDATYAAVNSLRFPDFINYYYFLCGSENPYFTAENDHQEMYGTLQGKAYPALSAADYQFASTGEGLSGYNGRGYIVLVRRGAGGQMQMQDYVLIRRNADGSCSYFKAQTDGKGTILTQPDGQAKVKPLPDGVGLDYGGERGNFFLLIPGYVFGREYTTVYETDDRRYDPGLHTIAATDGKTRLECPFYINKIDVTKEQNQVELRNLDKNGAITYNGCPIQVEIQVVDGYGYHAVQGKDYAATFYDADGQAVDTLLEPGKYTIGLDFSGSDRYTGKLIGNSQNLLHFEIAKMPVKQAGFGNVQAPYSGKSIAQVMRTITFTGTDAQGNPLPQVFKEGVDYTLTYSGSTVNAGSGKYTVTARKDSKYLTGSVTYAYTIQPAALTGYADSDICAPVTYNGTAQRPDSAWFDAQSGLACGKDYTIVGYRANTNAGIANVTIRGKGNYTGTQVLHFTIQPKSLQDKEVTVKCTPTANGVKVQASYKGKALQKDKDYTVKIVTKGNNRTVTVRGKGNFKDGYQYRYHVHTYKCTASKAATYFATGYKKYKCTGCGRQKTDKLAQLKPALSALKSSKKRQLTVKWKKGSGISGYQISYSTSAKFTKSTTKTVIVGKAGTTAKTLTKLKSKKKYYVRIRVYKKVKGGKMFGAWSAVKNAKVR